MTFEEYEDKPWILKQNIKILAARIENSIGLIKVTLKQSEGKVSPVTLTKIEEVVKWHAGCSQLLDGDLQMFWKAVRYPQGKFNSYQIFQHLEASLNDHEALFKNVSELSKTANEQLALSN